MHAAKPIFVKSFDLALWTLERTRKLPKDQRFVEGGADSRQQVHGGITLEDLQARHQRLRERLATMDDALAGVVPNENGSVS